MEIKQAFLAAEILKPETKREGRIRDIVFYSGAKVERWDWFSSERYWLQFSTKPDDVNLDRLNNGAPLLNGHRRVSVADQLGVVESAWLKGKKGMATVRFSERPEVDGVWQDVENRIVRNLSMGVTINQLKETTPKGAKEKEFLAVDWEPTEVSVVPVNADLGSHFLAASPEQVAEILRAFRDGQFIGHHPLPRLDGVAGSTSYTIVRHDNNTESNNLAPPGQQAEKDEAAENLRQLTGTAKRELAWTENEIRRITV